MAQLSGHQGAVFSAAFSPDGRRVVTASGDKAARVWDAATGKERARVAGRQGVDLCAARSLDGKRVVTASGDQAARGWDAATGQATEPVGGRQEGGKGAPGFGCVRRLQPGRRAGGDRVR